MSKAVLEEIEATGETVGEEVEECTQDKNQLEVE